jgi:hypothetical protein
MPYGIFHHPLDLAGSGLCIHHLADVGVFTKAKEDEVLFFGTFE